MEACQSSIWVIMPVVSNIEYTRAAIADCLAQSIPTRLLIINQGCPNEMRQEFERMAEQEPERIFVWSMMPPLPSLSASWNRALDFVWAVGGTEALVVNNDARVEAGTLACLKRVLQMEQALFVSAVGVTAEDYAARSLDIYDEYYWSSAFHDGPMYSKGGPDFSCFLISRECHARFRFDESFIPCYGEDCSYHRELMLAGEGSRIFSINLPYLHFASGTLKSLSPDHRTALERQINSVSRAHYARSWGGPVNHERYTIKGDPSSAQDGVTNPELQASVQSTGDARWPVNPQTT